jgi:hypothetical protein
MGETYCPTCANAGLTVAQDNCAEHEMPGHVKATFIKPVAILEPWDTKKVAGYGSDAPA